MRDSHVDFISYFWKAFYECCSYNEYENLLVHIEKYFSNYNKKCMNACHFNRTQTPFLAMISEIYHACPTVIMEKAEHNMVYQSALFILEHYSETDNKFLRQAYLKQSSYEYLVLPSRYQ